MIKLNKGGLLAILVIIVICFSGCDSLPTGKKTTEEGIPTVQAHSGTKGLEMEFMPGTPPSRIYTDNILTMLVELKNKGAYPISSGVLYLSGFDDNIIEMGQVSQSFTLEPRTQFNPEGGYDTAIFESRRLDLPYGTDSYKPKIVLTACYYYETHATPVVCIDPNPYSPIAEKACKPSSVSGGGGQGAPVSVSNVQVEPMPNRVQFKIDISNSGGGKVIDSNSLGNCPYNLDYQSLNLVDYSVSLQGLGSGNCRPSTPVRLNNGKASVYCTFDVTSDTAYSTPLKVDLMYGYADSITKQIDIRSIELN